MTQGSAVARVLAALETAGAQPRQHGEAYTFFCPIHADGHNQAGELRQGDKGALVTCHAGCERSAVVQGLGLKMADLFDDPLGVWPVWTEPDARYVYRDADGKAVYEVRRIGFGKAKQIRPFMGSGPGAKMGLPAGVRVPYRLPELVEAVAAGEHVLICEGERDADAAAGLGIAATTNVGGAVKWRDEYNRWFAGANVIVVRDRDEPGYAHARQVVEHLAGVVESIVVMEAAVGNDLCDHLAAGRAMDELVLCDLAAEASAPVVTAPAQTNGQGTLHAGVARQPDEDLDAFLNSPEPEYDWLIPGLLERGDRLIITGAEGSGKSTLLRQFAVQVGTGLHPFTLAHIEPLKVLVLDFENSSRLVRRKFRPLRLAAGNVDVTRIHICVKPEGIDLTQQADRDWLEERVAANGSDLVTMGPLYKLANGNPNKEEETAKPIAGFLDYLRVAYGFALIIETHSPHATGGSRRPERPFGASLWLRWPEFGIFLDKSGQLRPWRGGRDEREWPEALKRGGEWPWTPETDMKTLIYARMIEELHAVGQRMTVRDLSVRLGISKSEVQRVIDHYREAWEAECREVERNK